jgi:hypothetical protein
MAALVAGVPIPIFLQGFPFFLVFDFFSCGFHSRQKPGFGIKHWRFGLLFQNGSFLYFEFVAFFQFG